MKSIVKGGRAIIANDDGRGAVAVAKYIGGLIVVKDASGLLLYRGHDEQKATRQININMQMNRSTKRLRKPR